jgi:hypothetical protein
LHLAHGFLLLELLEGGTHHSTLNLAALFSTHELVIAVADVDDDGWCITLRPSKI